MTAITPAGQVFDENGGPGTSSVTARSGCAWEATPHDDDSSTLRPFDGVGSSVVTFRLARNPGPDVKSPYFVVGGTLRFQITQSACPATVSPVSLQALVSGSTFLVTVASHDYCEWTASSNDTFITATIAQRTGDSGTVRVVVAPDQTGQWRSGSVSIRGNTVAVRQEP